MEAVRWEHIEPEQIQEHATRQVVWGEKATMARFVFAGGLHVSKHSHPAEQFTTLLRGSMRMVLAGRELILRAGDLLIIPPHAEHEVWMLEDCEILDFFAPPRDDWKEGRSQYLAGRE